MGSATLEKIKKTLVYTRMEILSEDIFAF